MGATTMITDGDRRMAQVCVNCVVCRKARKDQRGPVFWLVKNVDEKICPFCHAYEKVYGKKPHERVDAASVGA